LPSAFRVKKSHLGYQLVALRDEDQAAESLGVNTSRAKMTGLIISGGLTALGGGLFAQYVLFLEPHSNSLTCAPSSVESSGLSCLSSRISPGLAGYFLSRDCTLSLQGLAHPGGNVYAQGIHEFFSSPSMLGPASGIWHPSRKRENISPGGISGNQPN
jgi:hypothetical protein